MSYLVHLRQFEGPLGLLLYLIRKEEMDIFDINVNEITKQYLDYIRLMKELDLELAGDFVAMAATLIQIKSRMLLPQYNEEGEMVEVDDPRKELVQKLLEYQRFQEAAKQLYDRPLLNRDVFPRGIREDLRSDDPGEIIIEEDGLFSLIAAYRRVVKKAQRAVHKVRPKVASIAQRVLELKDFLIVGVRVVLNDLVKIGSGAGSVQRTQLLVTFLSMLELGRMGFVSLFQSETYGDIHIETKKPIERNVLERVQEFETGDAEAVASSIINEAIDDKINLGETMIAETEDGQLGLANLEAIPDGEISDLEALTPEQVASDEEILAAELEFDAKDLVSNTSVSDALENFVESANYDLALAESSENEGEPDLGAAGV